jgi:hypothetical protein
MIRVWDTIVYLLVRWITRADGALARHAFPEDDQ